MNQVQFEWDVYKDADNQRKHGVSFTLAQYAFADPRRDIAKDLMHSEAEERYFCFSDVEGGVLTVRFTYRLGVIRIFGAGYWRKGKVIYGHFYKFIFTANCRVARCSESSCTTRTLRFLRAVRLALHPQILNF